MKRLYQSFLATLALTAGLHAEGFRTDINPALLYYQAFMTAQNVNQADSDYLTTNSWRGQFTPEKPGTIVHVLELLPEKVGTSLGAYDSEFKLMRQAAQCRVPVDWGLDMTTGPELLLPHLSRAKQASQIARLRLQWALQTGHPAEGRDDVLATLALGRNLAHDGVLISALVQVAMENILLNVLADNYYRIPPETWQDLAAGFAAAPPRGTMEAAIAGGEKQCFYGWFERKIKTAKLANPGNEKAALAAIRQIFVNILGGGEGATESPKAQADRILKAAGGTSDGVMKLLEPMPGLYDEAAALMRLPAPDYESAIAAFMKKINEMPNPLVNEFFPALENCRRKEIVAEVKLAMLQAAAAYRTQGEAGLAAVADPGGKGPFQFQKFQFEGRERGFRLTSAYRQTGTDGAKGFAVTLIFDEKGGNPFFVDGPHAAEAVPKPAVTSH